MWAFDAIYSLLFAGDKAAQWGLQKTVKTHGSACNWGDIMFFKIIYCWCEIKRVHKFILLVMCWCGFDFQGSFRSRGTMCCTLQIRKGKYLCFVIIWLFCVYGYTPLKRMIILFFHLNLKPVNGVFHDILLMD